MVTTPAIVEVTSMPTAARDVKLEIKEEDLHMPCAGNTKGGSGVHSTFMFS